MFVKGRGTVAVVKVETEAENNQTPYIEVKVEAEGPVYYMTCKVRDDTWKVRNDTRCIDIANGVHTREALSAL
jgi:hypothetical protein